MYNENKKHEPLNADDEADRERTWDQAQDMLTLRPSVENYLDCLVFSPDESFQAMLQEATHEQAIAICAMVSLAMCELAYRRELKEKT